MLNNDEVIAETEEGEYIYMSDIGTKKWFQQYVHSIREHATRAGQMSPEKAAEIHKNLSKFDPKFGELCKKAHDSAIELMAYTLSKTENK